MQLANTAVNAMWKKTARCLVGRINGHRQKFYACLKDDFDYEIASKDDDYALGLHLLSHHQLKYKRAFNESFIFSVLEHCSPFNSDLNEHLLIHRLKCLKPFGLNSHDPFGIPLVL